MVQPTDIHSLTDFLRNHKKHIARLRRKGRPEVLTVNGKAAVVVQDAAAYQQLLESIDRAEAIERIRKGLADIEAGRTKPAEQVLKEMQRKFKIPRQS